jgi:RNA polymerase subunit RPABC4/transcription elongation factor Spt4
MTLIRCRECRASISSSAPTCPQCRAPRITAGSVGSNLVKLVIGVIAGVGLGISG